MEVVCEPGEELVGNRVLGTILDLQNPNLHFDKIPQ